MKRKGINEFFRENDGIFLAIFGFILLYNFSDFSNEAAKSFFWLASSLILLICFFVLIFKTSEYSWSVSILTLPLSIMAFSFPMQFLIDLTKPQNLASVNFINSLFSLKNLLPSLFYLLLGLIVILVVIIRKNKIDDQSKE